MDDADDILDPLDVPPPEFWLTPENVARIFAESEADIAAGRLVPVEEVLQEMRARQAARMAARTAAAAE